MTFTRVQFDKFLSTLPYLPNPFQLKVLESIAFGDGNIVVSALAGSGKTTLLVQIAGLLNMMGESSSMFLAFNKKIRDELNERLPMPHRAINSHSLGLNILKSQVAKSAYNKNKWRDLTREIVQGLHIDEREQFSKSRSLEALCSKVMLSNTPLDDYDAIIKVAAHYSIDGVYGEDEDGKVTIDERLIKAAGRTIRQATSIWQKTGAISFDEMIYLPVAQNLQPSRVKYVFVDEAQDLSILQQEIAFRSLENGGRFVAVGDKHQAIYGFSGADAISFERISERAQAQVLPLNTCYRCAKTHIEMAQRLVPAIEPGANNHVGIIDFGLESSLPLIAKPGTMVMCRLNAPLISAYFNLIAQKIPAKVMGKDIGADLIKTLDRVASMDGFEYSRAIAYLEKYRSQQTAMLLQKQNSESQIEVLNDKVGCLTVCIENFNCVTLQGLKDVMLDLFGDDERDNWSKLVALCTVHKAKGLEADETVIIRPLKMPLHWKNQKAWEAEQERNILYVALTRAKKKLTILALNDEEMKKVREHPVYGTAAPEKTLHVETPDGNLVSLPNVVVDELSPMGETPEPETIIEESVAGESVDTITQEAVTETEDGADKHFWRKDYPPITPVQVPAKSKLELFEEKITLEQLDLLAELIAAMRERKLAQHG